MQQHWKGLGNAATVGLEFVLSIVLPMLFGVWLDEKLGTSPWMMVVWLGFGLAAGIRALMRAAKAATREAEELERREQEARKKYHEDRK